MNKNTVKRGLPPSSTRPIVKSELDPALFVKARQDLPAGTSPDEIDAYALRLEQFRKLLQLAAHFSVNVLGGRKLGVPRFAAGGRVRTCVPSA